MFPHYHAVSISTPVHSVTLGLPCQSLWPQLWAHLWCNPDWTTPTPLCIECTNYSLPRVLLPLWFCLLFAIFQQVSDLVTSTDFLSTTLTYKTLATCQSLSHLIFTVFSNYTSYHELSVLQPSSYSKYHICLQIFIGVPSATALLQHGIPFLPPSKIVRPYIVSNAT